MKRKRKRLAFKYIQEVNIREKTGLVESSESAVSRHDVVEEKNPMVCAVGDTQRTPDALPWFR